MQKARWEIPATVDRSDSLRPIGDDLDLVLLNYTATCQRKSRQASVHLGLIMRKLILRILFKDKTAKTFIPFVIPFQLPSWLRRWVSTGSWKARLLRRSCRAGKRGFPMDLEWWEGPSRRFSVFWEISIYAKKIVSNAFMRIFSCPLGWVTGPVPTGDSFQTSPVVFFLKIGPPGGVERLALLQDSVISCYLARHNVCTDSFSGFLRRQRSRTSVAI